MTDHPTEEALDALRGALGGPGKRMRALPPTAYLSEPLFELEQERIFRREWICLGRQEQLANPGDYFCRELAGESIVVVRDHEGELRALSNVCRHRFMAIVSGAGNTRMLECPYHRWSYRLDGVLQAAPLMDAHHELADGRCRLPSFGLEVWEGFVFVCLDAEAEPLTPRLSGTQRHVAPHALGTRVEAARYDRIWEGNWKLPAENAMESYHHFGLHSESVQPILPAAGTRLCETDPAWNHHHTPFTDDPSRVPPDLREMVVTEGPLEGGLDVIVVYPNLVFVLLPNFLQWLSFVPVDLVTTRVVTGVLASTDVLSGPEGEAKRDELRLSQEAINAEDESATRDIQRALRSRFATPGPLGAREAGVDAFHAYLASRLVGS